MKVHFILNLSFIREVPMELIRESRGREVHLQMEDHRTEEFISKKMRFQVIHFKRNNLLDSCINQRDSGFWR